VCNAVPCCGGAPVVLAELMFAIAANNLRRVPSLVNPSVVFASLKKMSGVSTIRVTDSRKVGILLAYCTNLSKSPKIFFNKFRLELCQFVVNKSLLNVSRQSHWGVQTLRARTVKLLPYLPRFWPAPRVKFAQIFLVWCQNF